jgi:hypothetical protein
MRFLQYLLVPSIVAAAAVTKRQTSPKALYLLKDDPAGASIMSLSVDPTDGTLSGGKLTSTGGFGGQGINASSGVVSPTDPIFTQDPVKGWGNASILSNWVIMYELTDSPVSIRHQPWIPPALLLYH